MEASPQPSQELTHALTEAFLDKGFREKLFAGDAEATKGLTDVDRELLKNIPRKVFDDCVAAFLANAPGGTDPIAIVLIWHRSKETTTP